MKKNRFQEQVTTGAIKNGCLVRFPYWHTCDVDASSDGKDSFAQFAGGLKFVDPVSSMDELGDCAGEIAGASTSANNHD